MRAMRLYNRRFYWLWFLVGLVLLVALWLAMPLPGTTQVVIALAAGAWGVFYFAYQQHLEEARFFRELFVSFNKRYDDLNDELGRIQAQANAFSPEQEQKIHRLL